MSVRQKITKLLEAKKATYLDQIKTFKEENKEWSTRLKAIIGQKESKIVNELSSFIVAQILPEITKLEKENEELRTERDKLKKENGELSKEEKATIRKQGITEGFYMTFAVLGIIATIIAIFQWMR